MFAATASQVQARSALEGVTIGFPIWDWTRETVRARRQPMPTAQWRGSESAVSSLTDFQINPNPSANNHTQPKKLKTPASHAK